MRQNRFLPLIAVPIILGLLAGCGNSPSNVEGSRIPIVLDIGAILDNICNFSDHPPDASIERVVSIGDEIRAGSDNVKFIDPSLVITNGKQFPLTDGRGKLILYGKRGNEVTIEIEIPPLAPNVKESPAENVFVRGSEKCR